MPNQKVTPQAGNYRRKPLRHNKEQRRRWLQIECLEKRRLLAMDFGDAPAPYPVTLAEDGARHEATGPRLGATVDSEVDGTHSANADGDGDDEDGVIFGTIRVGQLDSTATVNVQNAPQGAKLDAWLDFNGDGNWGGEREQIFDSVPVVNGDNILEFDVPGSASPGITFSRFRLSTDGGTGIQGFAEDGEVEDYLVEIKVTPFGSGIFSESKTVAGGLSGLYELQAADLDGDGAEDLIAVSQNTNSLYWYRNARDGTFDEYLISSNETLIQSVTVADLDGDGDKDLATVSLGTNSVDWFEADTTTAVPTFSKHTIANLSKPVDIHSVDIDMNGAIDLLVDSIDGQEIVWYQNDGDAVFEQKLIHTFPGGTYPRDTEPVDLNRDGYLDVLVATDFDGVVFLQNNGDATFTKQTISSNRHAGLRSGDLDNDGDIDFWGSRVGQPTLVYENRLDEGVFQFNIIEIADFGGASVRASDINGDGLLDLVIPDEDDSLSRDVVLAINKGNLEFELNVIESGGIEAIDSVSADLDGDGDLDLVVADFPAGEILWYEQNATPTLDAISDLTINVNGGLQTINLSGITAGANEIQPLRVTAISDNRSLIPDPTVSYSTPDSTGNLSITPIADLGGTATITVTVEDAGPDGDFATTEDNVTFSRDFNVAVFESVWQQVGLDIDGEAAGDRSGLAVSISNDGSRVAIGAPNNDATGTSAGQTRIYQRSGNTWNQLGEDIDGESAGDISGDILSLSGDGTTVAIGAWLNDGNGGSSGHTRVYRFDGTSWQQLGTDLDGENAGDESGVAVALSNDGNVIAIGARKNDGNGGNSGHARIYQWTGTSWQQRGSDIDGEAADDNLGSSISLSADGLRVSIGAHQNDDNGTNSGHVRVYDWDGTNWQQVGQDIDGANAGDQAFATSISGDGNTVTIPAHENGDNGVRAGHARIFRWNGVSWVQLGNAIAGLNAGDNFGHSSSLSFDGNIASFGAYGSDANGLDSGHVRVFKWSGTNWQQIGQDIAGEFAGDRSGWSHSLAGDGDTVAIGAENNDGGGSDSGHARIYTRVLVNNPPTLSELADLTIDEDAAEQTVDLTGIGAGIDELQPLKITAFSNNPGLIPNPTVSYTSPGTTGSISFTPAANLGGTATITAKVEDGGLDGDLATTADNATFTRTFDVIVNPINDDPTLDSLNNLTIDEDAAEQTINLAGIGAGPLESQLLRVTATSDNTGLIADPTVTYTSANATGSLAFTPVADQSGTATITVTVEDGGLNGTLDDALFAAATNFSVGTDPHSVSVGDFNGDGNQDLVTANRDDDNVSILLGDGSGAFAAATNFAVGDEPQSMSVGDFNGDGNQDLATANSGDDNVSILLGDGNGSFAAVTNVASGPDSSYVSVGDFNGDGKQDLVVTNDTPSNAVSILLGNGSGSFAAPTTFAVGLRPYSVAVGDFNGNGHEDLAVVNHSDDNVSILLGDGNGSFGAATNFAASDQPVFVSVGDFNGDGNQDLVTANFLSNNVSILLGDGSGSFAAATNFGVGSGPETVSVGDFNGDGIQDLATANVLSNNVSILLGDGTGSFAAATTFGVGSNPESVSVADFNGDGNQDLVTANRNSDNVSILLGGGDNATFSRTFDVVVEPVNDAPILDISISTPFVDSTEDSGVPNGRVGGLVSTLIGSGQSPDNFSDVDGDDSGIAITSTNLAGGTLWFSTDDGQNWQTVGSVGERNSLVLYGDSSTRLYFQPAVDFHGTIEDAISYKAWDRTGNHINGENDVNTAGELTVLDDIQNPDSAWSVEVDSSAGVVYVGAYFAGVQVYDVSNPSDIKHSGSYDTPTHALGVKLFPNASVLAVADRTELILLDVTNPDTPELLGSIATPGWAWDIAISQDEKTAYVADEHAGLTVVDITEPTDLRLLTTLQLAGKTNGIALSADGSLAFVTCSDGGGFNVVNIINPQAPTLVSSIELLGGANEVMLNANETLAYVADGKGGVVIVDISNPEELKIVDATLTANEANVGLVIDTQRQLLFAGSERPASGENDTAVEAFTMGQGGLLDLRDRLLIPGTEVGLVDMTYDSETLVIYVAAGPTGLITVDANLSTSFSSETASSSIKTIEVNDAPTLDAISDLTIDEDAQEQTIQLEGISAGGGEAQPLKVIAEHATPGARRSTYGQTITRPAGSVITDLNGDTHLDFAVVDYDSTTLNVFLNQGDGNFHAPRTFHVGQNPAHLAFGDFNRDGLTDFVTSNRWQNGSGFYSVSVVFGDGSGGFSESTELQVGQAPAELRVGDLNRDGIDDVVVTCSQAVSVAILISNGDGTFLDAAYVSTAVAPTDLILDDLDHDGDLDMIVANREGNEIQMFRGDGAAGFTAPSTIPQTGTWPHTLRSEDLNQDGNTDFVAVYGQGDRTKVSLHYGLGDGTFDSPATVTFAGRVVRVRLADFDGDDTIDIIATLPDIDQVEVAINDDSLSFSKRYSIPVDREPLDLSVADINGDGWNDVLVSEVEAGTVGILYTEQTSLLTHDLDYTSPDSQASLQISPSSNQSGNAIFRLTVEDGGLNGTLDDALFAAATNFSVGTDPHSVSVGDFNGDGNQDLVVANRDDDNVSILLGDGSGSFVAATNVAVGDGPQSISLGDFNGDGIQDMATTNGFSDNVSILLGGGDGSFAAATNVASGPDSHELSVGDFNGDGKQDLVVTNDTPSNAVSILLGDGTGSFAAPTTFAVGLRPSSVAVGDFNGNGHQDLAVVNSADDNVSILMGNGSGSFAAATHFAVNDLPVFVSVGDFNGDGNQDLVTANFLSNNVSILLGDGSGSFAAATNFGVGSRPETVSVGDFNGDGKQDLATANALSNNVSILLGDGSGSFAAATTFGVGSNPESVSVADFNGDGNQDLVTANRNSDNVSILLGGGDNATFSRTFDVVVEPVNDDPTLDAISELAIDEDAPEQTVALTGITAGGGESQPLKVTATSDNTGLIADPTVTYTSANATGSLAFTPVADQSGTATITVTVEDAGLDNDLATTADNATFSRTFDVVVNPVNDAPILEADASPELDPIPEDALPPVGAVGTVVSALIDANGTHDNFSDVDGDQPGLAIVDIAPQGGSVWISRDNGHTWNILDEASEEQPVLLLADMVSRVYFQPAKDFHGEIQDVLTIRAWDRNLIGLIEEVGNAIEGAKPSDHSGMGLALSRDGSTLAIGARRYDSEQDNVGQVRVFQWSGSKWAQLGSDIYGEGANDELGYALSLSADGTLLAVGAHLNDGTAADAGHARVYSWNGENWIQLGSDLDGYATNDWYGIDVDLSNDGTILAVGARDGGANDGGYTDVFRWNGVDWEEIGQRLMGQRGGGRFGQSISLSANGTVIAIGAEFSSAMTGEAFVYAWDGQQWQQMGSTFTAESSADRFGHSVSISGSGEVVAISAHYDDENGTDSGHTRIFQWNGADWEQKGQDIDGEAAGDKSGYDISLSDDGNRIAISARFNDGGGNNSGHARIYQWNGSRWLQFGDDIDGASSFAQLFRVALSGDGTKVATGNFEGGGAGLTTVYRLEQIPLESSISTQTDFVSMTVESVNDDPTIDSLNNLTIDEDAAEQTVNLVGITAGPSEAQTLKVTATSDNTALIPNPAVTYTSANATGSLAFTPVADQHGTATITVTVEDAGLDNDLATTADNATSSRTFVVVVNPVNDEPTFVAGGDQTVNEDSGAQIVSDWATDINEGAADEISQTLSFTVTNDQNTLFSVQPAIDTSGTLTFTPADDAYGTAEIVVTLQDDGGTTGGGDDTSTSYTRSILVNPINDAPVLASLPPLEVLEDNAIHGNGTNLGLFVSDIDSDASKIEFRIVNLGSIDPSFNITIGMDSQSESYALRGDNTIHAHPAADFHGSTEVVIESRDAENDVSNQRTFVLDVNSVNDRPTLDPAATLALPDIVEDSGAPALATGTLVSSLIDQDGPLANFSDIDGDPAGIAIIGVDNSAGSLWYSIDNGLAWQLVGPVSESSAHLLYADDKTRLYFESADDFSGDLADALTFKAWDRSGGYSNGQSDVNISGTAFSVATDTVALTVTSSPSTAEDDFFISELNTEGFFSFTKAELLSNDQLGNGETNATVAVIPQSTSSSGGTITIDGDTLKYTRPSSWFSGIDTFDYTLDDGGSTSTATVTILSGVADGALTVTLAPGRDHDVTLAHLDDKLVMQDHVTDQTLLNIPLDLVPTNVNIIGAPENSNQIRFERLTPIDSSSNQSTKTYKYSGGNSHDRLIVDGSTDHWGWLSSDPVIDGDLIFEIKDLTHLLETYDFTNTNALSVTNLDRVEISDPYLEVLTDSFDFSTQQPLNLPAYTGLSGGSLASTAPIALEAGESLIGEGIVNGPVGGGTGSLIRATGSLEIGTGQSSDGFRTDGRLETSVHTVTIHDSNRATLGELTTLGSNSQPGTIMANHGLTVPFTGNIEGYGTVDTSNGDSTSILMNNGIIAGNSPEEPITLTATVKGVGSMTNVVLDGTFTPGFSPVLSVNGDLVYSDRNTVEIELGGYLPGTQHDRVEHNSAALDGKLVALLIDGYIPRPGAIFEVFQSATDFNGSFDTIVLPEFANGLRLEETVDSNLISLEAVFDAGQELHVMVSTANDFDIEDWNGLAMKVRGSKFRTKVTPQHTFRSDKAWLNDGHFMKGDTIVQTVTDGTNRIDIAGSRWKNFVSPYDITNDGKTSVLDALTIINELSRGSFVDLNSGQLKDPSELTEWPDIYYDTNGDDRGTVLDALLVINELARTGNSSGEGEFTDAAIQEWSRDLTPISIANQTSDPLTVTANSPSLRPSFSGRVDDYVASTQVVDAEYNSMGSETLEAIDDSLLSLLAE